jgi:hypothetical protein
MVISIACHRKFPDRNGIVVSDIFTTDSSFQDPSTDLVLPPDCPVREDHQLVRRGFPNNNRTHQRFMILGESREAIFLRNFDPDCLSPKSGVLVGGKVGHPVRPIKGPVKILLDRVRRQTAWCLICDDRIVCFHSGRAS